MSTYLIDDYVATRPGDAYRLFPFGEIVKGGKRIRITPELARRFKLPHFKPPVKLGSHDERTPAGGHILALEVRDDGLYALPELTDKGAQAIEQGDYRYHSPEVIWDDGSGFEDPITGEIIAGPLIVGDALLHTPHLGEAAALYQVSPVQEVKPMEETKELGLFERFVAWLEQRPAAEPVAEPEEPQPDEYAAAVAERDQYKAQLEAIEAEKAHNERVSQFAAQLSETKITEGAEMLAGMTDEQSAWVVQQFKALSAQVDDTKLLGEIGDESEGAPANPIAEFDATVKAYATEHDVTYSQAVAQVATRQPELARKAGYK